MVVTPSGSRGPNAQPLVARVQEPDHVTAQIPSLNMVEVIVLTPPQRQKIAALIPAQVCTRHTLLLDSFDHFFYVFQ